MAKVGEKKTNYERYHVPNLKRGLEVFEMLAKNPDGMTLPEISKTSGYSRSSIFRILCTLEDCGYVVKKEDERTFRMSRKLAALGYAAFGESNIVEKGMDILRQMRDRLGETSMLGTMLDEGCVMIEQAPGTYPFKFLGEIGMRIPFHASAPGKAMLAFLPDSEVERKISKIKFHKYNSNTIVDKKTFIKEIGEVRKKGYAFDKGEEIDGVNCVGAPVFDAHGYPVAAIWITGPRERIKNENLDDIGKIVKGFADAISGRLGYGLL